MGFWRVGLTNLLQLVVQMLLEELCKLRVSHAGKAQLFIVL
jgi:hypothetical protein